MYTLCTSRDIYHRNGSHQVRDEFLCWSAPCPFWKNRPGITFCIKSFSVTCTALNTWPLGIHYLEICPVISPWGWDFPGSIMGAGVWWHSNWRVSRSEAAVLPFWICWVCVWWVTSNNELWELCRGWECWLFLVCDLPCPPQLPSHPRTGVWAGATEPDQPLAHRLHLKNTTTHSIGFADNKDLKTSSGSSFLVRTWPKLGATEDQEGLCRPGRALEWWLAKGLLAQSNPPEQRLRSSWGYSECRWGWQA